MNKYFPVSYLTNAIFFLFILIFFSVHKLVFFFSLFPSSSSSSSLQGEYGYTALIWAAEYGHDTVIPLLLEADAQIDAQDNDGWTPLILASEYGKEAAVRELLKGNPNLDLKDKYDEKTAGKTALDWARDQHRQSVVDLLVAHERS